MSKAERDPSYSACVAEVLSRSPEPLTIDELLGEIKQLRMVGAGGRSAVYKAVSGLYQAVSVSRGSYGWLSNLLAENTFRHPLTAREARKGFLMLDELEHAVFFPEFFQAYRPISRTLTVEILNGPTLTASAYIEQKTWALSLGAEFSQWIERAGGGRGDSIIIHVVDALTGRYLLRLQPHESRDGEAVHRRNVAVARLAEAVVREDKQIRRTMPTAELAAKLIARGAFRSEIPTDDLHYVLHEMSDLQLSDGGYAANEADGLPVDGSPEAEIDLDASAADAAMTLFGWDTSSSQQDTLWDLLETNDAVDDSYHDVGESCTAYNAYLERVEDASQGESPLSHEEYHMLEAELEYMVALEVEFGWLLPEQEARRDELARRLMLDPDSLIGGDLGSTDFDDPSYWEN
jgi:hypothetical protein